MAAEGGAELVRMDIAPARAAALSVFFTAFNEEGIIEETVRAASTAAGKVADAYEIIVVDDGSRDRTAEIVESLEKSDPHVRLVRHGRNRGYGAALRTGFESARYDLVFFPTQTVSSSSTNCRAPWRWPQKRRWSRAIASSATIRRIACS